MLRAHLLTLAGFVLAFGPLLLRKPDLAVWVPLGVMSAGPAWPLRVYWRTKKRLWLALLPAAGGAVFVVWYLALAGYSAPQGVLQPGDEAPSGVEAVRVRDGAPFRLAAQRGQGVLLVFFRGGW